MKHSGSIALAVMLCGACQISPEVGASTVAKQSAGPTADEVLVAMRSVAALNGAGEMRKKGFVKLTATDIAKLIPGNTLKLVNSYSYYGKDKRIRINETSLGGGLESAGTWEIKDSNLCHSVREGHTFCAGLFLHGDDILCWPGIGWADDDTDYLRHCSVLAGDQTRTPSTQVAVIPSAVLPPRAKIAGPRPAGNAGKRAAARKPSKPSEPSVDAILAAMRNVPGSDGIREMARRGFLRPSGEELRKMVTGNTLKLVNSYSYYGKDHRIRIKETSLSGGLESAGTWTIEGSNLCHSVREGHAFCSGLFVRGADVLCWPGIGWSEDDTDYLRHCAMLAGDQTRKTPTGAALARLRITPPGAKTAKPRPAVKAPKPPPASRLALPSAEEVLAALRAVPARNGPREMANRGFVKPSDEDLRKWIAGNTLKLVNAYSYYGKDKKIRIKETSLGGGLESAGTWEPRDGNLCHSVREGHEFCPGIFFRGADVLCWPGIGWSEDDVNYLRRCAVLSGNKAG